MEYGAVYSDNRRRACATRRSADAKSPASARVHRPRRTARFARACMGDSKSIAIDVDRGRCDGYDAAGNEVAHSDRVGIGGSHHAAERRQRDEAPGAPRRARRDWRLRTPGAGAVFKGDCAGDGWVFESAMSVLEKSVRFPQGRKPSSLRVLVMYGLKPVPFKIGK